MFNGTAGPQAVAGAVLVLAVRADSLRDRGPGCILCILIDWGWDSCLAVTEETKDADRTPGRAALLSTVILLRHLVLVAYPFRHSPGSRRPASGSPTRRTPTT